MGIRINIIGAGLAGSEAALQLASRGFDVYLYEMRPDHQTPVHKTGLCGELVCSNSLKSMKAESAAGMLKYELSQMGSNLLRIAYQCQVDAGGALAVDRGQFAHKITSAIMSSDHITLVHEQVNGVALNGRVIFNDEEQHASEDLPFATIIATGPLTDGPLACWLENQMQRKQLFFFDAAAPIVMSDSLDMNKLFLQSRYEQGAGDYLNAPFSRAQYETFIEELVGADRVIRRSFETKDLFQACQPIEEIARKGVDAPRFGTLKPVGLVDPHTGHRPWAAVQLRAENKALTSYNLVGFQTNLTFPEQRRVFRMIPGLEHAEFARYGVMHRNSFVDAPHELDQHLQLTSWKGTPLYIAGQLSGTEGYCEAIASGLHVALDIIERIQGTERPLIPSSTAFGALIRYATDPCTESYQPLHVNFGIMDPIVPKIRHKKERYAAYAQRGARDLASYRDNLIRLGIIDSSSCVGTSDGCSGMTLDGEMPNGD